MTFIFTKEPFSRLFGQKQPFPVNFVFSNADYYRMKQDTNKQFFAAESRGSNLSEYVLVVFLAIVENIL